MPTGQARMARGARLVVIDAIAKAVLLVIAAYDAL
jgi:hypothetical protein